MSNKKLFWLAFIFLSLCEFGQFAYSQNTPIKEDVEKMRISTEYCNAELASKIAPAN